MGKHGLHLNESLARLRAAIPRFLDAARSGLARESRETIHMLAVLYKLARGIPVSESEKRGACRQLGDLAKIIPAFAVFMMPGGTFLLPMFAKLVPFQLLPQISFIEEGDIEEIIKPTVTEEELI
jgi:hypothetical protein